MGFYRNVDIAYINQILIKKNKVDKLLYHVIFTGCIILEGLTSNIGYNVILREVGIIVKSPKE